MRQWENWDDADVVDWLDRDWTKTGEGALATAFGMLREINPESLLDVGSGTGRAYAALYGPDAPDRLPGAYLGIDATPEMLARATAAHGEHFQLGDLFGLEFADDEFAAACCLQVLPHIPHIGKPIRELVRVASDIVVLCTWTAVTGHAANRNLRPISTPAGTRMFYEIAWPMEEIATAIDHAGGTIERMIVEPHKPAMDIATLAIRCGG